MKKSKFIFIVLIFVIFSGCSDKTSEDKIDLSTLTGQLTYASVVNIYNSPDDYLGKTIKMTGTLVSVFDTSSNSILYGCLVQDTTACCSIGFDFEPVKTTDSKILIDGTSVTIEGVLNEYEEDGYTYLILKNAKVRKK